MSGSFSWRINRSQTPTMSWEPNETATVDEDQLTPERFWKWVDMCKDDDDFGISDDDIRAPETADEESDSAQQRHHFEIDPARVFDQGEMLGQGQLGSVVKMKIRGSDITFACKTCTTAYRVQKLRKEASLLRNLDHQHIVKFIGTFTPPGRGNYLSLIMSPVGEQNLEEFLRGTKSFEHRTWLKGWFFCLASALSFLHSNKIRHEDIKPSNIIHRGDKVLFTDFGSSTEFKSEITTSTESPAYGSPMYEAPEVLDKAKTHGARSDIFSLGCVYVEFLTAVAKGDVHELHGFCKEQSANTKKASGRCLYSSVVEHLDSWFARLCPPVEVTIIWKDIVQLMLRENRKERPKATQTLQLLQAGFIPFVLANGQDCCNHKDIDEVLSDDDPSNLCFDQILRDTRHSIQQVDSVDESLRRLGHLHHLLGTRRSITPSQQTFLQSVESLDNCFVDTFASQSSSSKSMTFLEIVLHYRLNLNAHGKSALEPGTLQELGPQNLDTSRDAPPCPVSSMLHAAAWLGHTDSVQILLNNGTDPNTGNEEEGTALNAAVWKGHLPTVKALLKAGADPNVACVRFSTCLWAAAGQGDHSMVQALIDAGADVNQRTEKGQFPIVVAVHYGHSAVVQTLLGAGADPNCRNGRARPSNILHVAARRGFDHIVQILLRAGADPNIQMKRDGTALAAAAIHGHSSVIRTLCGGGAKINAINRVNGTALMAACSTGQLKPVKTLISMGADVNQNAGVHGTAHTAASKNNHQEIVRFLEEAGARSKT